MLEEGIGPDGVKYLFQQMRAGEFAIHSDQAEKMTAHEFAALHGAEVREGGQLVVEVDGCDYFWSKKTGKYDGWGRSMVDNGHMGTGSAEGGSDG